MTDHTTPSDAVQDALDGENLAVRVTHPRGQITDYVPCTEVNGTMLWCRLWEDEDVPSVVETEKVIRTAQQCDPDVEVINEEDSLFGGVEYNG